MKISKHNIKLISISFCCYLLLSLVACKSNSLIGKVFSPKHYRIAKVTEYSCCGYGNRDSLDLESERIFSYFGDKLVSIRMNKFNSDGSSYEYSSDSIIYTDSKKLLILWEREGKKGSFSIKTKDFFISDYFRNIGRIENQTIYCDKGCWLIEHSKKHYELLYVYGGNIFYCSKSYFLNDDGYIVKTVIEDDKSFLNIYIYEYELGYNPYHYHYIFSVIK